MSYALAAPLQAAIHARLSGDAAVAALCDGKVFDAPPDGPLPPVYVAIGQEDVRDASDQTGRGALHRFTVRVVDAGGGFFAAKQLGAAVDAALTGAPLAMSGGRVLALGFERARARRNRDGLRREIELRFYARLDET